MRIARSQVGMNKQRGAALIVGLLLLLVVTLLAVSGMNTASLELVMAGNTQYQQNAFRVAEEGIERTLKMNDTNIFNPSKAVYPATPASVDVKGFGTYSYQVVAALGGAAQPAIWTNSVDAFSTYHFEVPSTGTSSRNARVEQTQGVAVLAPKDHTVLPMSGGSGEEEPDTELHFRDAAP